MFWGGFLPSESCLIFWLMEAGEAVLSMRRRLGAGGNILAASEEKIGDGHKGPKCQVTTKRGTCRAS